MKGDFRSTKRLIARSASSHSSPCERDRQRRLGVDDGVPRTGVVDLAEDLRRVEHERVDERRVELRAPSVLGERDRRVDAADAVSDLGDTPRAGRPAMPSGSLSPANSPGQPRPSQRSYEAPSASSTVSGRPSCTPSSRASAACRAIMSFTSRCPEIANSRPGAKAMQGWRTGPDQAHHAERRRGR